MKTTFPFSRLGYLIGLSFLLSVSCSDPVQEDFTSTDPVSSQEARPWPDLLDELIVEGSLLVPKNGSIQEAVDEARPGDAIYIEAGQYPETVTLDKEGIRLIGLDGSNGEKVIIGNPDDKTKDVTVHVKSSGVEIVNIQYQNSTENSSPVRRGPSSARMAKRFISVVREEISPGMAHYQFVVRLGKGPYDVVRIHRVVREYRPYRPLRTRGEIFMVHGASQDFDDIFLTAGAIDNIHPQTSSPVYLASRGIDVWGIDLAWTLVPEATNDLSFMKDWGVERDVDHTLAALTIARLIRGLTGQGLGRLNLLGFSYGVPVIYAAAGRETQKHPILRSIKGIVPVEAGMKYDPADEDLRALACDAAAGILEMINAGNYASQLGIDLAPIGHLAMTAPNDPFPFPFPIPGLTNAQVAIAIGAGPNPLPAPFWHFVAGNFDENGVPVGLAYTEPSRWFYLLTTLAPYMPQRTVYEFRACLCDEVDVSMDDYLNQISVPILYLGAGGGFGTYGDYTSSLTASRDVTNYTVSLQPAENRLIDYGHADVFMANNAAKLVWEELRQWLLLHHSKYLP